MMHWARAFKTWSPIGMIRSAVTQTLPSGTIESTAVLVTSWIVDPAYPASVVTSDGLVIPTTGVVNLTATASIGVSSGTAAYSRGIAIYLDSVLLGRHTVTTSSFTSFSVSLSGVSVTAGQRVTMRAHSDASTTSYRNLTNGTLDITA